MDFHILSFPFHLRFHPRRASMFRNKRKSLLHRTQKHLRDLYPVLRSPTSQQSLQLTPSHIRHRSLLHRLRIFQQSHRHIAAQKRQPFQQKSPRPVHSLRVASPMLQSIIAEPFHDLQSLPRGNIPMSYVETPSRTDFAL